MDDWRCVRLISACKTCRDRKVAGNLWINPIITSMIDGRKECYQFVVIYHNAGRINSDPCSQYNPKL